ncbi:hypothetical protein PR048_010555 [Dryococelus australis]|uniref:Uncharacterized protein n=1 Tax=Dryococelus australis TaxID=614101 RepID=A0ABQ9I335_9NEOP|nr:hypothetical protein PR048_010555 [Dryococelus australis]
MEKRRSGRVRETGYPTENPPTSKKSGSDPAGNKTPIWAALNSRCLQAPRGHDGSAVSLLAFHQGDPGSISDRVTPDFSVWESCRTMPLVAGFSRGYPVFPPFYSGAAPYSPKSPLTGLKASMLRAEYSVEGKRNIPRKPTGQQQRSSRENLRLAFTVLRGGRLVTCPLLRYDGSRDGIREPNLWAYTTVGEGARSSSRTRRIPSNFLAARLGATNMCTFKRRVIIDLQGGNHQLAGIGICLSRRSTSSTHVRRDKFRDTALGRRRPRCLRYVTCFLDERTEMPVDLSRPLTYDERLLAINHRPRRPPPPPANIQASAMRFLGVLPFLPRCIPTLLHSEMEAQDAGARFVRLLEGLHCAGLDSTFLCTIEPQMFVHWLLLQREASVTPHLAVWHSLLVSLQVCYWLRVVQGVSNELHALDDSAPIADLQGNKKRIPRCQMWGKLGQQPTSKHLSRTRQQNGVTYQQHVATPQANRRAVTCSPTARPANREVLAACGSQSDTRSVLESLLQPIRERARSRGRNRRAIFVAAHLSTVLAAIALTLQ